DGWHRRTPDRRQRSSGSLRPPSRVLWDRRGSRSRREGAGHVLVVGRSLVAGDGRVVDDGGAAGEEVQPTADTHAGDTGGAGAAGEGRAGGPARAPAGPGGDPSGGPAGAARPQTGLVARDGVGGLGLRGALLRPQPGLEGEGAGRRIEGAAA